MNSGAPVKKPRIAIGPVGSSGSSVGAGELVSSAVVLGLSFVLLLLLELVVLVLVLIATVVEVEVTVKDNVAVTVRVTIRVAVGALDNQSSQ